MIPADLAARALALGVHPPFDRLSAAELLLVARYFRRRVHAPGEIVLPAGQVAERLMVVMDGTALVADGPASSVFDAASTLFGLPIRADYRAGPDGAEILSLARPHLFTLARECPDFIVGFLSFEAGSA
ncbi:Crp/Fnr family transcriptional regulator [Sphingopyxis flava]|uniref:Cyclic nucleotide-binding domain-containing protein n=1 Tax=Sphingopyxis flava TaxID=1507287 RepID=A0A1T5BHW8_9SPHN|nr:Crp/Fnr family transcriptional regulator [Sphingopyxis flava]SKB46912.1 hypothetical protein SAMN06295937_1006194 [Sphingopyxis flava]